MQTNTYLSFDGQCEEAFRFYARCLGGTIEFLLTHGESPMGGQTPREWKDKVMHACLRFGDAVIMGADSPPPHHQAPQGFAVAIHVKEPAEADRIFAALSEGGEITMPLSATFWAKRFGMFTDRYGVPWMINCEDPAYQASLEQAAATA